MSIARLTPADTDDSGALFVAAGVSLVLKVQTFGIRESPFVRKVSAVRGLPELFKGGG